MMFDSPSPALCALGCLNSNLFYWFITLFSDCRHVNKREAADNFPVDLDSLGKGLHIARINALAKDLVRDLKKNSDNKEMRFAHDILAVRYFYPKHSMSIIDEIDRSIALHYGFADEELDFIIHCDIKYRMGGMGNSEAGLRINDVLCRYEVITYDCV